MNNDSSAIAEYIRKQDVAIGAEIIKTMNPDIIITTMPCVRNKMNMKLKSLGYKMLDKDVSYGYDVLCKNTVEFAFIKPEWQEKIDKRIEDYILPSQTWELGEFIQQLIDDTSRYKSKAKLRKYIFEILVNKIRNTENVPPSIAALSCFQEHCTNPLESMRNWLRYQSKSVSNKES